MQKHIFAVPVAVLAGLVALGLPGQIVEIKFTAKLWPVLRDRALACTRLGRVLILWLALDGRE